MEIVPMSSPSNARTTTSRPIDAGVSIGHVHLKVADLDRALGFYCGVLGFKLTQRYGTQAAFVAAGGYHHHIGLNTWESQGGTPPPPGATGLFHLCCARLAAPVAAARAGRADRGRFCAGPETRPRHH